MEPRSSRAGWVSARSVSLLTTRSRHQGISAEWDLFSAGVFEQDAELVSKVLRSPAAPRRVCAIAAGVREFGRVVDDPDGVFGIAQWFPGSRHDVVLGPAEDEFLACLRWPRG